jgi:hypothetical protein
MKPDAPYVIGAALQAVRELAAGADSSEDLSRIQGLETLLVLLQKHWDTAASDRVATIDRYSELARRGAQLVGDPLRSRLADCTRRAAGRAGDLRISSLEDRLDGLREAIIDLQTWLEAAESPEARTLLDDLWRAEYEDAERRVGFESVF